MSVLLAIPLGAAVIAVFVTVIKGNRSNVTTLRIDH
jgi:hypothetical protein